MKILVSEQADLDLLQIHSYLVERNPKAAWQLANRFFEVFLELSHFPLLGRDRSNLLSGVRSIVAENHVVFYTVDTEAITILRVLNGRRDIETELQR
jgi:toxin ParE1/3/4